MSELKVTVEHPGAHEPAGETFPDDFGKALTSALHDAGLKRGDGFTSAINGYAQTSGVSTIYNVEVTGTEPSAEAIKAKEKADADAAAAAAADAKAKGGK